MSSTFYISTPGEMLEVVKYIVATYPNRRILALYGDLGAGKTTLVKAFARQMELLDEVSSPTFSLVNEYLAADGSPVYHLDLYRLESLDEALAAGIEEYFHTGDYCFIEWPELAEPVLPSDCLKIQVVALENSLRKVVIL